jgi:hemoglobin
MQTVFEAGGGMDGLCRLADAWHRRVLADEVVAMPSAMASIPSM